MWLAIVVTAIDASVAWIWINLHLNRIPRKPWLEFTKILLHQNLPVKTVRTFWLRLHDVYSHSRLLNGNFSSITHTEPAADP